MMDKDLRELANRLFTVATAILEDATLVGVAGQSSKLTERRCRTLATELHQVGLDIATIADTAALAALSSRQMRRSGAPYKPRSKDWTGGA